MVFLTPWLLLATPRSTAGMWLMAALLSTATEPNATGPIEPDGHHRPPSPGRSWSQPEPRSGSTHGGFWAYLGCTPTCAPPRRPQPGGHRRSSTRNYEDTIKRMLPRQRSPPREATSRTPTERERESELSRHRLSSDAGSQYTSVRFTERLIEA